MNGEEKDALFDALSYMENKDDDDEYKADGEENHFTFFFF